MSPGVPESTTDVGSKVREELKRPSMYKVVLHNDDYTTMDFVVHILRSVFNKPGPDAVRIMLDVHHAGTGLCGVYTAEVAETKVATVHSMAQDKGWPLKCSMEPE